MAAARKIEDSPAIDGASRTSRSAGQSSVQPKRRALANGASSCCSVPPWMRCSEVCNLRLDDVEMEGGCIIVDRLKGSLRTVQALSGHRGEPLLDEYKALNAWPRQRPDDGSYFLFTSQKGGKLRSLHSSSTVFRRSLLMPVTPGKAASARFEALD